MWLTGMSTTCTAGPTSLKLTTEDCLNLPLAIRESEFCGSKTKYNLQITSRQSAVTRPANTSKHWKKNRKYNTTQKNKKIKQYNIKIDFNRTTKQCITTVCGFTLRNILHSLATYGRFRDLIERNIMSDHAPEAVDNSWQSDGTRRITVAIHLRHCAAEIKHGCPLNTSAYKHSAEVTIFYLLLNAWVFFIQTRIIVWNGEKYPHFLDRKIVADCERHIQLSRCVIQMPSYVISVTWRLSKFVAIKLFKLVKFLNN